MRAGRDLPASRGNPRIWGPGPTPPVRGRWPAGPEGVGRANMDTKCPSGAVPGGVLPNPSLLPAKPNEVGSPGRGGARERAQFSPPGGNGVEWTLRRRAAMGKVGRRPQAAKSPLRGTKPLYHRPLIRHGFAVPPSPQGEGFLGESPLIRPKGKGKRWTAAKST